MMHTTIAKNLFLILAASVLMSACEKNEAATTTTPSVQTTDQGAQDTADVDIETPPTEETPTEEVEEQTPTEDEAPSGNSISERIVWKNWYLSIPLESTSKAGYARSIGYQDLQSKNLSQAEQAYFGYNDDGSFNLFTKFTGYTTSGHYETGDKKYCRTELREYWRGNQDTQDNWYFDEHTHEMHSTLSVDFCEGEGLVFVGQIHGKSGDALGGGTLDKSPATVKVFWEDDKIHMEYYTTGGIQDGEWTSNSGVVKREMGRVDDEIFTIKIKVENGKLYGALVCAATSVDTGYIYYYDYKANDYNYGNYFKTGNYFKHDDDYTAECNVTLYNVYTNHSNW